MRYGWSLVCRGYQRLGKIAARGGYRCGVWMEHNMIYAIGLGFCMRRDLYIFCMLMQGMKLFAA